MVDLYHQHYSSYKRLFDQIRASLQKTLLERKKYSYFYSTPKETTTFKKSILKTLLICMSSTTYTSDATTTSTATLRKAIFFLPIKKMNLLFLNLNILSSRLPDCSSPSHCWKATQQWDESNFTRIFYLSSRTCYDTAQMPKCEQRNFYNSSFS